MRPSSLVFVVVAAACGRPTGDWGSERGVVAIDGSSTVFPITEAVAEEFAKRSDTRMTVAMSGTGGGFKRVCKGEVAVTGASRPIDADEIERCRRNGVELVELAVAYDGLAIVVNPAATWVDYMTTDELARLWSPTSQGKVVRWSDVRRGWPDDEVHLFGAGIDSGTYDYFTRVIVGTEHVSRGDYTSSEDDNLLVHGIATDKHALGFFGYSYYAENRERLKLVPIDDGNPDNGSGPVAPSAATVRDGTYQPLTRAIFLYVALDAAARPEVATFVDFYLARAPVLAEEVGYIALPETTRELVRARFAARTPGSIFDGRHGRDGGSGNVGARLEELLRAG